MHPINIYPQNNLLMCCFYFICSEMKRNFHQVYNQCTKKKKQNPRPRSLECYHYKMKFEPYGDSVDQACSQFNKTLINTQDLHIAKSKIENHPGQNIPMKIIQKTQK